MKRRLSNSLRLSALALSLGVLVGCSGGGGGGGNQASNFLLRFQNQPRDSSANATLPPVRIILADPFGNPANQSSAAVTLLFNNNPGGATLSGTTTVTPVNGIATFNDLSLDRAATGYTFLALATGFDGVVSAPFTITDGAPTRVGFVTQPSQTIAGQTIAPPVQVALQDASGAVAVNGSATITLALFDNPGAAVLSGTLSADAVNGIATFPDLSLDRAAAGYTLVATAPGLTDGISQAFTIDPGAVAQIAFSGQPASGALGVPITASVTLSDALGNIATNAAASVRLVLDANPDGARLAGDRVVDAVNGVATFTGLRVGQAATGLTLTASSLGFNATSQGFDQSFVAADITALSTAAGPLAGCVPISYTLTQPAGARVELTVEYDSDGSGSFTRARQASNAGSAAPSSGANAVPSSAAGADQVFLWDSTADLGGRNLANLSLRVTASIDGQPGAAMTLTGLTLQNGLVFAPRADTVIGGDQTDAIVADINGDGRPDVAAVQAGAQDQLAIALQDPANPGAFLSPQAFPVGDDPQALAAADINGDGLIDLATADSAANTVTLLLRQAGALSFSSSTLSVGADPRGIAIGDLNQDGAPDIAVACRGARISLLFQDPLNRGSFNAAVEFDAGNNPQGIALADLNGDGRLDLAAANGGTNDVTIRFQSAATPGDFSASTTVAAGIGARRVVAAELNNDGRLDLAVANPGSDDVSIILQSAVTRGAFNAAVSAPAGAQPRNLSAADLDNDGRRDLAVAGSAALTLLLQDPAAPGSFPAARSQSLTVAAVAALSADLTGNGRRDILAADAAGGTLAALANLQVRLCETGFLAPRTLPAGTAPADVLAAELTGDGRLDQVVADGPGSRLLLYAGDGRGGFADPIALNLAGNPAALASADLNNDGALDLIAARADGVVTLLFQDPANPGAFPDRLDLGAGADPSSVAVGFLDQDGAPDIVVCNRGDNSLSLFLQDPGEPGAFLSSTSLALAFSPSAAALGAIDSDLFGDLAVANPADDTAVVFLQDPANPGQFTPQTLSIGDQPIAIAIADLDGDGRGDLASANAGGGTVSVVLQDPANPGTFLAAAGFAAADTPSDLTVADLDGDGQLDLAVSAAVGPNLGALFQDPANPGSFLAVVPVPVGPGSRAVAAGDLDGDASLDLSAVRDAGALDAALQSGGLFQVSVDLSVNAAPSDVIAADLDGDGLMDAVSLHNGSVVIRRQDPANPGAFLAPQQTLVAGASAVAVGDINGDGRPDLAIASATNNSVTRVLQSALNPGVFVVAGSTPAGTNPQALAIADVNRDGFLDVVALNQGSQDVSILLQGGGLLTNAATAPVNVAASRIAVGDLNNDGLLDIVVDNPAGSLITVAVTNAAPLTFGAPQTVSSSNAAPGAIVLADVNRDGRLDILTANGANNAVGLAINNGAGFTASEAPAGGVVLDLAVLDLNDDGILDVVVAQPAGLERLNQDASGAFTSAGVFNIGDSPARVSGFQLNNDGRPELIASKANNASLALLRGF